MAHWPFTALRVALLFATLGAPRLARAQSADYPAAWALSERAEREGRAHAAAEALAPAAVAYPDDFAVALRMGWLRFTAGEYEQARAHYAHALRLSDRASIEARLGLAWTLQRQGRAQQARRQFEAVLASSPENASAREGLALVQAPPARPVRFWGSLTGAAAAYVNTPARSASVSVGASALAQLGDRFLLGASYRLSWYDFRAQGSSNFSGYLQHEAHVQAGLVFDRFDLRAHFAYLADEGNAALPAWTLGASANVRLLGTLHLEALGTAYRDTSVFRLAGSWMFAATPHWSFGPALSAQYGNGALGGSVGARVAFTHRSVELSLAGRYGSEFRPTYLNEALTYATNNNIRGAISLTGRVPLTSGLSLTFGYEWLRFAADPSGSTGTSDFDAHQGLLGVSGSW